MHMCLVFVCAYGLQGSEDFDSCSNRMAASQQQNRAELQRAWLSQLGSTGNMKADKSTNFYNCLIMCMVLSFKQIKSVGSQFVLHRF